jgi:hypothetical protein
LTTAYQLSEFFASQGISQPRVKLTFDTITEAHRALRSIQSEFERFHMHTIAGPSGLQDGEIKVRGIVFKIEPLR